MSEKQLFYTTQNGETIYLPAITFVGKERGMPTSYRIQGHGNLSMVMEGYGADERSKFVEAWKAALS